MPRSEWDKLAVNGYGNYFKAGLGLFAAYNIVKKHQGDIRVENEIGRGTTVTLEIPTSLPAPR